MSVLMLELLQLLTDIESTYGIELPCDLPPVERLRWAFIQLYKSERTHKDKLTKTMRDLAKTRRKLDEAMLTWHNFGKYIGANSYDLEKIFGIERETRQNKADRKQRLKERSKQP